MAPQPNVNNPMEARSQEIVAEARRRLADGNGKASQLPQMIQRVTQEFEQQDQATRMSDHGDAMQMPDDMNNYIDRVLEMSGMKQPASGGAPAAGGQQDAGVPLPPQRPQDTAAPAGGEMGPPVPPGLNQPSGGMGLAGQAAGLGVAGGVSYLLLKALQSKYGKGVVPDELVAQAQAGDAVDPRTVQGGDGATNDPRMQQLLLEGPSAQKQLTGPEMHAQLTGPVDAAALPPPSQQLPPPNAQLEAPPKQITGPQSAVDQSIAKVDGASPSAPPNIDELIAGIKGMNAEDAMKYLRQNGVSNDVLDEVARAHVEGGQNAGVPAADSLAKRAKGIATGVAKNAARKAM